MRRHAKPVYRQPLQELYEAGKGKPPAILQESLSALRRSGLTRKGLFTDQADARKVQLLARAWDKGMNPLKLAQVQDCHAVAQSLLLWLQQLPSPIVPCRLFRLFLRLHQCSNHLEALLQLQYLIRQLEPCELSVLSQLLEVLHDYKAAQREEGFLPPSLGSTFGPVLLRAHVGALPLPFPEDLKAAADVTEFMITNYSAVFAPSGAHKPTLKPPSRAKWNPSLKSELRSCGAAPPHSPKGISALKFAARAPGPAPESWPGKHLRVVVVPPCQDAEVCYMDSEDDSATSSRENHPSQTQTTANEFPSRDSGRLAPVPEGSPLSAEANAEERQMDQVVCALLSGSMESTLFEEDDSTFFARTSSLLSCVSAVCSTASHCGDSVDMSSVEDGSSGGDHLSTDQISTDSPLSSPQRPPRPHLLAPPYGGGGDLRAWLATGR